MTPERRRETSSGPSPRGDLANSGDVIELIKGGWVLLTLGGIIGLVGLVLAAVLPARIDQQSLACGFEFVSNVGVLESSLDSGRCPQESSALPAVEVEFDSFSGDATAR